MKSNDWLDDHHKQGGKGNSETIRPRIKDSYHGRSSSARYTKHVAGSRAGAPEAVVKVVSNPPRGSRVKKLLDYLGRADHENGNEKKEDLGVELEDSSGVKISTKDEIKKKYENWSEDFEKKDGKRKHQHVRHMVLSTQVNGENSENLDKVKRSASAALQKKYAQDGFEYVFAVHKDTKNTHVHVVIKSKNIDPERKKLRIQPEDIFDLRRKFSEELTKNGLRHVATLRKDRAKAPKRKTKPERQKWEKEKSTPKRISTFTEEALKSQKQVDRALKRDTPARNVFLHKDELRQTHERLHKELKGSSLTDKDRLKAFNELRKVRREILDKGPSFEKSKEALENNLKKKIDRLAVSYERSQTNSEGIALTPEELKEQDQIYQRQREELSKELARTNAAVERDPHLTNEQKTDLGKTVSGAARQLGEVAHREKIAEHARWVNNEKNLINDPAPRNSILELDQKKKEHGDRAKWINQNLPHSAQKQAHKDLTSLQAESLKPDQAIEQTVKYIEVRTKQIMKDKDHPKFAERCESLNREIKKTVDTSRASKAFEPKQRTALRQALNVHQKQIQAFIQKQNQQSKVLKL